MIQRKHSLGYIEFIRGRYNEKKLNNDNAYCNNFYPSINYLIEQMNEDEITNINTTNGTIANFKNTNCRNNTSPKLNF